MYACACVHMLTVCMRGTCVCVAHVEHHQVSELQRQAIYADPNYNGGDYSPENPPNRGLAVARQIAMVSYRTHNAYFTKFGRRPVGNFVLYAVLYLDFYLDFYLVLSLRVIISLGIRRFPPQPLWPSNCLFVGLGFFSFFGVWHTHSHNRVSRRHRTTAVRRMTSHVYGEWHVASGAMDVARVR
jgi:hypothetical protein